jgi:hypothetical protein
LSLPIIACDIASQNARIDPGRQPGAETDNPLVVSASARRNTTGAAREERGASATRDT